MTLIHPDRQNIFLNLVFFALIALVAAAVIWLILLYNRTVSLTHGISDMRDAVRQIEVKNSELKGRIFALFDPDAVARFVSERGMVADRTPQYSPITSEWVVASQR